MRRYSPPYRSPPRRGYRGRGRSPPRSPPRRRGYDGYGGRRESKNGSLLVRNVPMSCRPEELRVPFERFGPVRDVYLPKDYYTGEPRGFAFVQFVDPFDASDAQYHMNGQLFGGRELTVVVAAESRKRPEEMRGRDMALPSSSRRHSHYHGRSRSPSRSHSPRRSTYSSRRHSRSYSPGPRRHGGGGYSVSPQKREPSLSRSRSRSPKDRHKDHKSYLLEREADINHKHANNGYDGNSPYGGDERRSGRRSPVRSSASPPGSRSRSADASPRGR